MGDALAAERAFGILETVHAGHVHGGAGAGVDQIPDAGGLDLVADLDAAHALDALRIIPLKREIRAAGKLRDLLFIGQLLDIQVVGDLLQSAVPAPYAGRAVAVVLREDQLHIGASRISRFFAVGMDHHTLFHDAVAGGEQALVALRLDHTDAAGADLIQAFPVAERGNMDAGFRSGIQNRGLFGNRKGDSVNRQIYHLSDLPPLNAPQPK